MAQIQCKTCDAGELVRKKVYRMSGVVVVIGYILLIPSILGMLIGGFMLLATGAGTGSAMNGIRTSAQNQLTRANLPQPIITKVMSSQQLSSEEMRTLTPSQRIEIDNAQTSLTAGTAGAGIGATIMGGMSVIFIIVSLVGGLLGWLLVMKKKVLQCVNCGAVTAAS